MPASRLRQLTVCACIAGNALSAGSIFCFPLVGPPLQRRMGLTLSQTTSIALGAILGQYISAPVAGRVADRSARLSSLCGAVLHGTGYSLMALSLTSHVPPSFTFFVAYYVLVGAGTVSSYLAAITTATRTFPKHPGLAIGFPSAIFSISPLLLTSLAGLLFVQQTGDDTGDVDPVRLFSFFALLSGLINLVSAYVLHAPSRSVDSGDSGDPSSTLHNERLSSADPAETSPLVPKVGDSHSHMEMGEFLRQKSVWLFFGVLVLINGPSEIISQNLGSMSEALMPSHGTNASWPDSRILSSRAHQIQIFSGVNTASRLIIGFLADMTSPLVHDASGNKNDRLTTPRLTYLQVSAVLLFAASIYASTMLRSIGSLWFVTTACSVSYGALNVIGPSLIAKVWSQRDFGRNFGLLWSLGAIGPVFYGYLYGAVSDHYANSSFLRLDIEPSVVVVGNCKGPRCFQLTFGIIAAGCVVSFVLISILKRQAAWKVV